MSRTRSVGAALVLMAACGGDGPRRAPGPDAGVPFTECDGTDQAFVRQATLALLGRRPHSQAEVNVYADLMAAVRGLADADADADADSDADADADADAEIDAGPAPAATPDPREVAARALMDMDALQVPRIEEQSQRPCYGASARDAGEGIADGSLARFARDNAPQESEAPGGRFTMLDILRSALHLDDLSIVYRAHLFALVARPIPAANVPPVQAELARREDFGLLFDATYLDRDLVCLACHNSEASVTFSPDPALNRHWPMPGLFETAIYGEATGIEPERAHAPFRHGGLLVDPLAADAVRPWGWDGACGAFAPVGLAPDPAGIDGKLASLTGDRLTVFDLEAALARGFASLADRGLVLDATNAIADPDAAMSYLVAATIVEGVWREVIGTPLTIANHFPRNQPARDLLTRLTGDFIASRYSLRELLVDIVTSDYFNRRPPDAGCGAGPYDMPAVYDPWVTADPDPARRMNGPGDAVVALSPRVLLRAAHDALEWPRPLSYAFPEDVAEIELCIATYTCEEMSALCARNGVCCDAYQVACADPPAGRESASDMRAFERGIGVFLKHGEKGFRGLDFQARLVFEDAFGSCVSPGQQPDFIARLVARASATPAATVEDVVAALKDRLVGQAGVARDGGASGTSELAAIEAVYGAAIATPATAVAEVEAKTRALCGVLLSSPLFLLGGLAPPDASTVPLLTPEEASYRATCASLSERELAAGLVLTCGDSALAVSPPP